MAIIKKFKNGKIKITLQQEYDINPNGTVAEYVYHDDMFMADLCISNDECDNTLIVDYNTRTTYTIGSYLLQNPLKWILDELQENGKMYLYPDTKKESEDYFKWMHEEEDLAEAMGETMGEI